MEYRRYVMEIESSVMGQATAQESWKEEAMRTWTP